MYYSAFLISVVATTIGVQVSALVASGHGGSINKEVVGVTGKSHYDAIPIDLTVYSPLVLPNLQRYGDGIGDTVGWVFANTCLHS